MTSKWKTVCIQKILFQVYKVKGKAWREMIAKLRYRTFNLTSACNCISEFIPSSDLLLETTVVSIDQSWCKPSGFIYLFFLLIAFLKILSSFYFYWLHIDVDCILFLDFFSFYFLSKKCFSSEISIDLIRGWSHNRFWKKKSFICETGCIFICFNPILLAMCWIRVGLVLQPFYELPVL